MFGPDPTVLPHVSAVVVAHGEQPGLRDGVESLLGSTGVTVDVVLVNSGGAGDEVRWLAELPGVTVVGDGVDHGLAAGRASGVAESSGDYVALVDAGTVVDAATLARLVRELDRPEVGVVTGAVLLEGRRCAGTAVHVLGLCWPDDRPEPQAPGATTEVAAAATLLVTTREHWERLAEVAPVHDDTELSLRTWRTGLAVVTVAEATARRRDEPRPGPALLEVDRLRRLLTLWSARCLVLLAPPLLALELAMVVRAARQGWLGARLRGWRCVLRDRRALWVRRRALGGERRVPDRVWMRALTDRIAGPAPVHAPLDALARVWWRMVSPLV